MTYLCGYGDCRAVATWQVVTQCECLNYRCDACKQPTQSILEHAAECHGPNGYCARCQRPMDPNVYTWRPIADSGPQAVDEQLGVEVDAAVAGLLMCSGAGCWAVADWRLVMPCGHAAPFCSTCKPAAAHARDKLADAGTPYVCAKQGPVGSWADFVWEAIA